MKRMRADVAIIGGGTGGCAAALGACEEGATVILTEEHAWMGGQLTSQLVPPDEHGWIERFGCTASYRRFRNAVRDHYRRHRPLQPDVRAQAFLNPGNSWVSPIAHEPGVAHAVLVEQLGVHAKAGRLSILRGCVPRSAQTAHGGIARVVVEDATGTATEIDAEYFLDATELGELLALAEIPHVTGQESHAMTREPSAPAVAAPANQQAITWCFAMDYRPDLQVRPVGPANYAKWRDYRFPISPPWPGPAISWNGVDPRTLHARKYRFEPNPPPSKHIDRTLWTYRRIVDRSQFVAGAELSDVVVVNWPQNDYIEKPLVGESAESRQQALVGAREQSLALFHWLQTEAGRPDGGSGWPGLRLCPDIAGTTDGLAMAPYIRESRRIRACTTVREQDVSASCLPTGSDRARDFADSVGIGSYRIDLHPSTGGDNFIDVPALPFQVPLGALIPVQGDNLIAAAKNIGTTHITNGCYRLHPVEWNIGEVAGRLAAHCVENRITPRALWESQRLVESFRQRIIARGIETAWPTPLNLAEGDPHAHAMELSHS